LGLLHDLLPKATFFGVLVNPKFSPGARALEDLHDAARKANEQLFVANATNDAELDASFASLRQQHVSALLVNPDPYFDTRRERIIAFAAQERLPAVYQFREYALAGGLISYGPSVPEGYRQAGIIGLLYFFVGLLTLHIGIGALVLLWYVVWTVIRCIKGLLALNTGEPIGNPNSWWFGEK
jgi:hypothetical protein